MRLIDADTLIERIHKNGIIGEGYSSEEREYDVECQIDDEPTIEAEPVKHGCWHKEYLAVPNDPDYEKMFIWTCSECDHVSPKRSRYCWSCGSRMDCEGSEITDEFYRK